MLPQHKRADVLNRWNFLKPTRESTLADQNSTIDGEINIQEAISQRIVYQEEKRQSNIVAVLNEAAESLGDKTVEDHEPDHDWTARFFNEVQDVSSDDMRTTRYSPVKLRSQEVPQHELLLF